MAYSQRCLSLESFSSRQNYFDTVEQRGCPHWRNRSGGVAFFTTQVFVTYAQKLFSSESGTPAKNSTPAAFKSPTNFPVSIIYHHHFLHVTTHIAICVASSKCHGDSPHRVKSNRRQIRPRHQYRRFKSLHVNAPRLWGMQPNTSLRLCMCISPLMFILANQFEQFRCK